MLTVYRIPLTKLINDAALPLTRDGVISIVSRIIQDVDEIRIVVTTNYEEKNSDAEIEIATIELNAAPDGKWWLQYISHPLYSGGLTAAIFPSEDDSTGFVQMRKTVEAPRLLTPLCAEEMERENLGPLASLNLRLHNPAPLVPSTAHSRHLSALLKCEPEH
jgi:hypothetical protein